MKQGFALLLAGSLLALGSAPALAVDLVPPHEVLTMLRSTSFEPLGRPVRQGANYIVRAVDRRGEEVRLVVDAYSGRVRSVAPTGHGPRYAAPVARSPYDGPGLLPPPYYGPGYGRGYGPGPYYGPGPRVVRVLPDYDDEPAYYGPGGYPMEPRMAPPPRVSPPQTRAAAKPPLPRARPSESPAAAAPQPTPVQAAPEPAAPEPAAGPAPDGQTPPPVGFE